MLEKIEQDLCSGERRIKGSDYAHCTRGTILHRNPEFYFRTHRTYVSCFTHSSLLRGDRTKYMGVKSSCWFASHTSAALEFRDYILVRS